MADKALEFLVMIAERSPFDWLNIDDVVKHSRLRPF